MREINPPRYSRKLLKYIISDDLFDDIDGDLTEIFYQNTETASLAKARWQYLVNVLFSVRNINLRRKLNFYNPLVMYKNYLKITFRNLLKYKGYSFINIFGLALGMASCLLILLFVHNERSFDGFHEKKSNIYRLDEVQTFGAVSAQKVALSMYPMGPNLVADYPEIVNFSRYWTMGRTLIDIDGTKHYIDEVVRVDTSFFEMFDFKLIMGNMDEVFSDMYNVTISESTAKRIFGNENPIGQLLKLPNESVDMKVVAVMEDVPDNSHLQFDALISTKAWDDENRRNRWGSNYLPPIER
jgi:putative ABC transport system permease protein